jgi:hypothetical protein
VPKADVEKSNEGKSKNTRRRREVRGTRPSGDLPAARCELRILHPNRSSLRWLPGDPSLSLADALRRRLRRHLPRLHRNLALGNLASDVAGLTVKSPTGSERTAPKVGYFFFFAALRFAGAFFFAAVFAFAFFTMLPS